MMVLSPLIRSSTKFGKHIYGLPNNERQYLKVLPYAWFRSRFRVEGLGKA